MSEPAKRRRAILGLIVATALLLASYWQWRADYHLWRVRAHQHAPSREALLRIGPAALPKIYAELHELGTEPAGRYRSDLVHVVVEIRRQLVSQGDAQPDHQMLEALELAILGEADPEQQRAMIGWLVTLDFDMRVLLTCAVFSKLTFEHRHSLLVSLETEPAKAQPSTTAACLPPLLVDALAQDWSRSPMVQDDARFQIDRLARTLAGFDQLEPDQLAQLINLIGTTSEDEVVYALLRHVGDQLALADAVALQSALARALQLESARSGLTVDAITKLISRHAAEGLSYDALLCESFAFSSDELRFELVSAMDLERTPDGCVHLTLMDTYERRLIGLADAEPDRATERWMFEVERTLARRVGDDPRIGPWARRMLESVEQRREPPAGLEVLVHAAARADE